VSSVLRTEPRTAKRGRPHSAATELAVVVLLLLTAAFFRFYRFDSVPAGIYFDIAFNAKDARDVLAGHFPIFFPRNNGREALFIYFQTLILKFSGFRLLSFTFSSAFMGILGVATTYRLWKALFGWRVASLAALLLAVFLWDVTISRLGFRVNSLVPFINTTLYLLWRAMKTGRSKYSLLAGLSLGLTLYTYTSARLLPVLVIACWACPWPISKKRLGSLALVMLVATAVFAPEGVYFLRHPNQFLGRIQEVSLVGTPRTGPQLEQTPVRGALQTGGMFFVKGDHDPLFNLIGRPIFEPWQALLFLIGIVLAVARSRHSAASRWALCCLVIMLLPSALSMESPGYARALGASPAVFLFPALVVEAASRLIRRGPSIYGALALAVVIPSAIQNFNLYFEDWANNADTFGTTDVSRMHMANFVAQRPESRIYFADSDFTGHIVRALVPSTEQDGWIPEPSSAIPIPSRLEGDTLYVGVVGSAINDLAPAWIPDIQRLPQPLTPFGKPEFVAFSWSHGNAQQFLADFAPVNEPLGDFELLGYQLIQKDEPGVSFDALWRPLHADGPYDMFVHLLDESGVQVSQSDRLVWPVKAFDHVHEGEGRPKWGYYDEGHETGDRLLTQHQLKVAAGSYIAEFGVARRDPHDPTKVFPALGVFRAPVRVDSHI